MKSLTLILLMISSFLYAYSVVLLITGEVAGNAIYEMAVSGAKRAAQDFGFEVKVVEGGYNPARWATLLTSLAASRSYDLIVTFTEGMPKNVETTARAFPNQKIVLVDAIAPILPNVYSVAFKDEEMAYLAGYFAALVTKSDMPNANEDLKVGMIAGDVYPAMMNKIKPAYEKGVKDVDPNARVIFSVVGSWADPSKGAELAQVQYEQGVDVIFLVAGGSGMGAVRKAREMRKYVIGVDSNYIERDPEVILACALKHIDRAIYEILAKAVKNQLKFGTSEVWGIKEGMIGFTFDDPNYLKNVPKEINLQMLRVYEKLKEGLIAPLP
ncbi:BMP family ABC transporter substrate-binding protein [Pseudothermotoga sp.]|nr:BMP family ABC transporter substrate-binding protein [Pseudothermotoga sp.]MCX7812782.1 BMP family ABC transporter substrate-binding protein [Pseudothermotoga sp.]MDW8139062.1 BMP family ABC transporter substrate-binding protein [Pseudothermotoga sp.]